MKEVKLSSIRIYELAAVVDSVPLKEYATIKDIRLASNVVKDLKSACKEFSDEADKLSIKKNEVIKKYQEDFQKNGVKLEGEEKDKFVKDLDTRLNAELEEKFGKEQEVLDASGMEIKTFELGDEKYEFLKAQFEKYAKERYLKKDVLLEVAEALGI